MKVFKKVLEFLYTDTVSLSLELAPNVLVASDFYNLPALFSHCERLLESSVTASNVLFYYTEFCDLYNAHALKAASLRFILAHFDSIRHSREFVKLLPSQRQVQTRMRGRLYRSN